MLLLWLRYASSAPAYVCIHSGDPSECASWNYTESVIKITDSNFEMVTFNPTCREMFLGIGNVPDLLINLTTAHFSTLDQYPKVYISNSSTINNVITFDFESKQNNLFSTISFDFLNLKPSTYAIENKIVHTTASRNGIQIPITNGRLLDGYRFDWNIYLSWSQSVLVGDLYLMDLTKVDPTSPSDIMNLNYAVFSYFIFSSDGFDAHNGKYWDQPAYIPLDFHDPLLLGGVYLYTSAYNYFTFDIRADAKPTHGFNITSEGANLLEWKGNWTSEIHFNNNGVNIFTNQTDIDVIVPNIKDCNIPMSIQSMDRQNMSIIVDTSVPITFRATWDVYDYITIGLKNNNQTEIPKIVVDRVVFHTPDAFVQYNFMKYEPSNAKKSFAINILEIAPRVNYVFNTKLYGSIWEKLVAGPATNITYNEQKKPLYYSQAVLEFLWDPIIGFPYVQVDVSNFSLDMVFTDNESIENIENANETYQDIFGIPQKILCGIGLGRVSRRLFTFKSPNPCFQERGVWKVIWSFDGNGSDPDKDPYCLWVNMTEWPYIPPPIIPTPTLDPAAINRNSMIVAIMILVILIIAAIGGCFTLCFSCGQKVVVSTSDSELERELLSTSSSSYSKPRSHKKEEIDLKNQDKELDPIIKENEISMSVRQQSIDPYVVEDENVPLLP